MEVFIYQITAKINMRNIKQRLLKHSQIYFTKLYGKRLANPEDRTDSLKWHVRKCAI